MTENGRVVGIVGLFDDPQALVAAAARVRDAGWRRWDCHTPYPVHGLDRAMGLRPSRIPTICLSAGLLGAVSAMAMQGWMSVIDYPVRVGGKPLFSWPAFVPLTFELFVLFAALSITGSILVLCRLWRWHSPLHDAAVMAEVTTYRFGLVLDAADARFSLDRAKALLADAGCRDIRPLHAPDEAALAPVAKEAH